MIRTTLIKITVYTFILLVCFYPKKTLGHNIDIYFFLQNEIVFTNCNFNRENIVHNRIKIINYNNCSVINGKANQKGLFSFKLKNNEHLKIITTTICGHKKIKKISNKETKKISNKKKSVDSLKEIELIILEKLDQNLIKINNNITELNKKKYNIKDIIGGLGYFLGLIGLGTYFNYKKIKKNKK